MWGQCVMHTRQLSFIIQIWSALQKGRDDQVIMYSVLWSSHSHTRTFAKTLKFLLFWADLWITLFSSSYGTTSNGSFSFELTGFNSWGRVWWKKEKVSHTAILWVKDSTNWYSHSSDPESFMIRCQLIVPLSGHKLPLVCLIYNLL